MKPYIRYSTKFVSLLDSIRTKNVILELVKKYRDDVSIDDLFCVDVTDEGGGEFVKFKDINTIKKWYYKNNIKCDFDTYLFRIWSKSEIPAIKNDNNIKEDTNIGNSTMKIGRFVTTLLKTKIPLFEEYLKNTDRQKLGEDIEEFINLYKAHVNKDYYTFDIVSGENIRKSYNSKNYISGSQYTSLTSCMSKGHCQSYLDLYVNNPEICKLLVMRYKSEPTKIAGRALLWTLTDGRIMMDQIYKISEPDHYAFLEKASEIGAIFRDEVIYKKVKKRHNNRYYDDLELMKVEVKIRNFKHFKKNGFLSLFFKCRYPFMDTLKYFNTKTGILTNNVDKYETNNWIILRSVNGSYKNKSVLND